MTPVQIVFSIIYFVIALALIAFMVLTVIIGLLA